VLHSLDSLTKFLDIKFILTRQIHAVLLLFCYM